MKFKFTIIILLIAAAINLNTINLFAKSKQGQEKIDSLFIVLKLSGEDTSKIAALNAVSFEYRNANPDTAVYFAKKALELANKLADQIGVITAKMLLGLASFNLERDNEAIKNLNDGLQLCDQILISNEANDKSKILNLKAKILNIFGGLYYALGEYSEALKYYFPSLKIREEIGDSTGIADSYYNIGIMYRALGNYPEAFKNYFASLKIKEKIGDKKSLALSYENIGVLYSNQGNFTEALKNYNAALINYKLSSDTEGIVLCTNNIGTVYTQQGNYPEALKNHLAALRISEEKGDKKRIASAYTNIANVYHSQKNYSEAKKYDIASLNISKLLEDKESMGWSYNNIGTIYEEEGNYSEALKNYYLSLKMKIETGDKHGMINTYNNIGNNLNVQDNLTEALNNYLEALNVSKSLMDKQGMANSYYNIGAVYLKEKKINNAYLNLNKSLLLAKEINGFEELKQVYGSLSELKTSQNKHKEALEHYKMYIIYRDTLINEENTKKMVQSQMQYEFDKKETLAKVEQEKKDIIALKELQKQKLVRNGFIGGFAVVILFAGVFFKQRNKISKGKKLSDELLLNILPFEVAEELKLKGSAEAKQFDDVTVMFTDFKNFTQISEMLTPAELVAEIDTCFKAFDIIIGKHNIEKIKTIGDSYMCAGGLPVANKTNAADVVNAALEIQNFMLEQFEQRMKINKVPFEIRIGIHTGPVVAGIVGIKKFAYDIWGDTVNIASRMESSCETGKVNISGSTYELVKDKYTCTPRGKIQAKNKGEIDMYFVHGIL